MTIDLDWDKSDGLIPGIVQDADTGQVLMLGYLNREALDQTITTNLVTFYSRARKRLWTKGETSGHTLHLVAITSDCDQDTLLIQARPQGPTCHLNLPSCFEDIRLDSKNEVLTKLEQTIRKRKQSRPDGSYTSKLFAKGRDKIAQKVGEEAVEVVIASKNHDDQAFIGECADLVFHLSVLLSDKDLSWSNVMEELQARSRREGKKPETKG